MKKEEKYLLQDAAAEIKQLRQANQAMGLRLQMFDDLMLLFRTGPAYQGIAMSEDVVYKIEKAIVSDEQDAAAEKMPKKESKYAEMP